jgi:chromosome segregation protein
MLSYAELVQSAPKGRNMRLKHLQLQGYKTFATKTEFLFPSGVTAIVGPNGSGKSNIADAIRWALGEQSYTALRGKRTEDMIFSGSQSRPRAGMAEVILTLDNSDSWLPVDFSEVTLGRRAYRDGQNEYRINGNRVRLRDISELLSQSGLSRRTYTIIGQGLVDAVLSLRAQERRELFEEAAGIVNYRDKREDALRKLDETQRNLERVHDIISEIEPRLKRLQVQADRTQEHKELSAHLEQLLRAWYGYQWGRATRALDQAQQIAQERTAQHDNRLGSLQTLAAKIDQTRQVQNDLRRQLGDWHRQSSALHTQAEEGQRELAVLAERSRQLAAQREEHLTEIVTLDVRLAAQAERVTQAQADLVAAQQAVAQHEQETQAAQAAFDARVAERRTLSEELNATQEQQAALRTKIAEHQSRLETLGERVETLITETQVNQGELSRLNDQLSKPSSQLKQVRAQLTHLVAEQERAQQTLDDLEQQRRTVAEQLTPKQAELRQIQETEGQVAARFELLSQLRRDFAIYGQAARALLAAPDPAHGIKGVLAQMIRVPTDHAPEIIAAVEAALGVYASAVVVTDWRTALNALHRLQSSDVAGRVVLLPLESRQDLEMAPLPLGENGEGIPLSTQVDCDDALRPLVDRLLGHAYLVPDLETAQSKLPHFPHDAICVTSYGEVIRRDGTIEGGRPAEKTSPIAQEREWSQLNTHRIELGAQRETLETMVAQAQAALEKIYADLTRSRVTLDDLDARRSAANTICDRLTRQIDRLQQEIDWRQSQIASSEADLKTLYRRQDELRNAIGELAQVRAVTSDKIQLVTAELETLTTEALNEDLKTAQMALAAARQTHQGQQAILHELETNRTRLDQERQARQDRVTELTDEESVVAERIAHLTQDQTHLTTQLDALKAQIEPAEARLAALEKEQRQLEATERIERTRLHEFEGHLTAARLDVQRCEDRLAQLRSRIEEDLGLVELELGPSMLGQTPLPLHPLVSKIPIVQQLPEGLEDEIKRLRAQQRRLGAVNPNAPAEYQEALERHSFLQEQSSDLVEASDALRQIIAEMDGLIEHAFQQTFEAVASEFSMTFATLFDGGQARLELTDPDDLTQTGVEIAAQPPGKRLQSLASLSGGERALTAVALIFSILKVSPTPFCILDEVDAMLDAANIGRFRAKLESLTEHTQFVLITHNRGTISAADTVYGVSMGADSVSQVYSIRMDGEKIRED